MQQEALIGKLDIKSGQPQDWQPIVNLSVVEVWDKAPTQENMKMLSQ